MKNTANSNPLSATIDNASYYSISVKVVKVRIEPATLWLHGNNSPATPPRPGIGWELA